MSDILVLFDSRNGMTEALAREICHGVDSVPGMASRLRTVPAVSSTVETRDAAVPASGPPYVELTDLAECAGLVLGSPTHFGNMTAPLKYFFDNTVTEWLSGTLDGKPAGVFTSTSSLHGGQETTLLTMASPYGASHVSWSRESDSLSDDEKTLARALGKRVADIAKRLGD
jgi:NAD(P)H dehydrogenase (quinone)